MNDMLVGAIVVASAVAGLFFLRFWKTSGDRFFLYFSLSFFIEGGNRLLLGTLKTYSEDAPWCYLIRLLAYSLILWAIFDKNRPRGNRGNGKTPATDERAEKPQR